MSAYYNEHEPYAAEWLRNLIKAGHIADGEVDTRSIVEVVPDDLRGYTQCHFFAGIGGWSLAARLAGWPDDRPLWTGSCPCQPFSVAGQGKGQADERHLWPEYLRLISACRPPVVMGEQVAAAVGKSWLDGVYDDLESIGYATGAVVVPACAVGAPHRRDRLWFVADAGLLRSPGVQQQANRRFERGEGDVADADRQRAYTRERNDQATRYGDTIDAEGVSNSVDVADATKQFSDGRTSRNNTNEKHPKRSIGGCHKRAWDNAQWLTGADGKARRVEPGIRLLAHGVPARVGKLRAYGNAIVPQVAAEIIAAYMEMVP